MNNSQDITLLENLRNDTLYSKLNNLINTNQRIPNYNDKTNELIDLDFITQKRGIFFLGNDFDWFITKKSNRNRLGINKFFSNPYYFYSTSKTKKTFGSRRTMIDIMFDYIFLYYSDYFVIYLSDNSDINIMTIAYYLLSNFENCVLIMEKINSNVFTQIDYELDQLRQLIYLSAKKYKCKIFFSKQDFINSFINPLTDELNMDLFLKLQNDNQYHKQEITEQIINRFDKLKEQTGGNTSKYNNINDNVRFLTYPMPIDYDVYHKYSVLTKHMKEKLALDTTFNILRDTILLRQYYYTESLWNKDILNKNEKRIKRKLEFLLEQGPQIRMLNTDTYFNSNHLEPFSKFLFHKKQLTDSQYQDYYKQNNKNPLYFIYRYLNQEIPIQKNMMRLIRQNYDETSSKFDLNNIDINQMKDEVPLLFQKIVVTHLLNELNESRYFIHNILYLQSCYSKSEFARELKFTNIFICILSCFDNITFDIIQNPNNTQIKFYPKTPFYNKTSMDESYKNKSITYTFKSAFPRFWVFELIQFYYSLHPNVYNI